MDVLSRAFHTKPLWVFFLRYLPSFVNLLPVIVLEAVHLSNFSLSKRHLSNLLFTCCTGETSEVVRSLQCSDHMICDGLPTRPAKLQTGLRHRINGDDTNIFYCLTHLVLQTTYRLPHVCHCWTFSTTCVYIFESWFSHFPSSHWLQSSN